MIVSELLWVNLCFFVIFSPFFALHLFIRQTLGKFKLNLERKDHQKTKLLLINMIFAWKDEEIQMNLQKA